MVAGLGFAFLLAVLGAIRPAIVRGLMPIALVTQTMPLVALTPLLVLLLGRGIAVTIAITISVTFFPAYVTLAQGLALVPRAAFDLARAYGASGWRELRAGRAAGERAVARSPRRGSPCRGRSSA